MRIIPRSNRASRLVLAITIALALAATHVFAQFGSFPTAFGAFEGELWGVRQELALPDGGEPDGLAYHNGILYVADSVNQTVVAFDSDGVVVPVVDAEWGGGADPLSPLAGFTPGEMVAVTVVVDDVLTPALMIADMVAHRAMAFDTAGAHLFTLKLERPGFTGAAGAATAMAMGPAAQFVLTTTGVNPTLALEGSFAAGWTNQWESEGVVLAYSAQSSISYNSSLDFFEPIPAAALTGTEAPGLTRPGEVSFGVTFDAAGNLYTHDTNAERVNVYHPDFSPDFRFGTPAFDSTVTEFEQPYGMAYSSFDGGRLFIGDSDHHRVEIYRPNLVNNTLDYVSTIAVFGDALPRSVALDPLTGRLAVSGLDGQLWILDKRALAAFNLQVLDAAGVPTEEICTGATYQVRFSLTVPAGGGSVSGVVPQLLITEGAPVGTAVASGVYSGPMSAGDVATFTYTQVMPDTVPLAGLVVSAGATTTPATDVLFREAVLPAVECVGNPPSISVAPSIPFQVSGWTPVRSGETLELTFTATDDFGVASIEYEITGQNDSGLVPPVENPTPGATTQTLAVALPESGYSTIRYRAHDSHGRKSAWQEIRVRIQPVLPRLSVEGTTVTFAVGLPIGSGFTFGASELPPGMSINPQTGQIGGTLGFDAAGVYNTVVTETLGTLTSNVSFEWTVINANQPPIVEALTAPFVVDEGSQFQLQMVGYDPDGDPSVFTMFGHSVNNPLFVLPQTVSINPVTGLISGYFPFGSDTEYQIFVGLGECSSLEPAPPCFEVLPGERLATLYQFTMTVTPVNQPPFAFPPTAQASAEGDLITLPINGSDPDNDPLTYQANNLPPGLAIDANTGVISGTIGYNAVQTPYAVIVEIDDHITATYSITFTWTVANTNRPPTVAADARTDAEGDVLTNLVVATASDPDGQAVNYSAAGLPPGLTMDAAGAVSGTLGFTTAGTYNVIVTVSDGSLTATAPFVWTVTNTNAPPTITNPGNQTNAEGDPVSVAIAASDVDPQVLTYSALGLPTGLSIDTASGLITGSLGYDTAGPYAVTVTVTDGPVSRSVSFTWTVTNVNRPPVVVNPGTQNSVEGAAVTLPISASDPDLQALTYTATGLPPGLSISPATGVITGTLGYAAAGTHSVTVTVTDGSLSDSEVFTWNVGDTNRPPNAVADFATAVQGQSSIISVLTNDSDPDGASLSIVSVTQPANGTVVLNTNGTVTYSANGTFLGSTTFSYTVTDGVEFATATVTVDVNPSNRPPVCSAAFSSADLWPPNHRRVYVTISGVTDPDGGTPTILFTSIVQDEPTNSVGQGNTMQDGGIENDGATAWVRAERSGTKKVPGDGRVYLIGFTATDASGASCIGTIRLDVPHDQRGTPAVLSPGRWDSTTGLQLLAPPAPVANNDTLAASTGSSSTLAVLSNDVSNGESLAVSIVSQPSKGRVRVNSNGSITYTPPSNNWTGTTSFTYQVRTPSGSTDTAVVTVTVTRSDDDDNDHDGDDNDHDGDDNDHDGDDNDHDGDDNDCGDRNHDHNRDNDNRDRDHRRGDHDRCTHGRR